MKMTLWVGIGLLSLVWTGAEAIISRVIEWSAGVLAAGGVSALGQAVVNLPAPAWLSPWLDLAGWRELVQWAVGVVESVSDAMPMIGQSLDWLVPLVWVVWGMGLFVLLMIAFVISRLL